MVACHFPDRDSSNNRLDNLKWATPLENQAHMKIHGTERRGERNGRAVLSPELAERIRSLRAGGMSQQAIVDKYGVGQSTVSRVIRGEIWANHPIGSTTVPPPHAQQ